MVAGRPVSHHVDKGTSKNSWFQITLDTEDHHSDGHARDFFFSSRRQHHRNPQSCREFRSWREGRSTNRSRHQQPPQYPTSPENREQEGPVEGPAEACAAGESGELCRLVSGRRCTRGGMSEVFLFVDKEIRFFLGCGGRLLLHSLIHRRHDCFKGAMICSLMCGRDTAWLVVRGG